MLALSSRTRARHRWNKQYGKQLKLPYHRLITSLLEFALIQSVRAIAIGYRDPKAEAELENGIADVKPHSPASPDAIHRAFEKSASLTGPGGTKKIPIWLEDDKGVFLYQFTAIDFYSHFVFLLESRLLSIGASAENPQPLRYVEITPTPDARRFMEIDLEVDRNNVFWIRLRGDRIVKPGESVSPYYTPFE